MKSECELYMKPNQKMRIRIQTVFLLVMLLSSSLVGMLISSVISSPAIVFEDDFESGNFVPPWTGTQNASSGSSDIVTTAPYMGSKHARFWVNGTGTQSRCYKAYTGMSSVNSRVYFRLESYPNVSSVEVLEHCGTNAVTQVMISYISGTWRLTLRGRNASTWITNHTSQIISIHQWYAIEIRTDVSGTNGNHSLWFNETLAATITGVDSNDYGNVTRTYCGIVYISNTGATEVFIDACAIGDSYIGRLRYTLTITASEGGTTSPAAGSYAYDPETTASVTAIADNHYLFDHWELDGSYAGSDNPTDVLMGTNHTLHAVFQLITYKLTILNSTDGTTDPIAGNYTYTNGTNVAITAMPNTYYVLDYWLLDDNNAGSANPITVLMTANHTLQPVFARINYTLTISTIIGGTTDPELAEHTFSGGTNVSVSASPSSGYRFDYWVFDDLPVGSANPINILMNNSHTLQAVFAETHTLIISASEGGTTDPIPETYIYDDPTNVSVQALPSVNYFLDHWTYDGENVGSQNPITVYVGSSHHLHAVFSLINYTLTITTSAGGTTDPTPGIYLCINGTIANVTAMSDTYYVFEHWLLDDNNVGSASPYSVLMDSNHTLHAVFVPINYTLTITATAGGTTSPALGSQAYNAGINVSVTAIPDVYYSFDHWELDGVDVGSENPYSVLMDNDHVLHAVFATYDVAISDITLSKTVVGQGYGLSINVTVVNQGNFTETFNVTLYANAIPIGSQTVNNLPNKTFIILTFTWNTTAWEKGNYTISAYASPVLGETDTTDNTLIDGWIILTIPGDVNGDFKVDGKDVAMIAKAFNANPEEPLWNPNADIDNDLKVDGKDIAIAAKYYNTYYP
jgi:hypothetical protein